MKIYMSLSSRRELLIHMRSQYHQANWQEKRKILDGFIATTGYQRKYAITILNQKESIVSRKVRIKPVLYNEAARQALLTIWYAANQIYSKRMVPFMPELIQKLEGNGYLLLPSSLKDLLLNMSPATVDRLLKNERQKNRRGIIPFTINRLRMGLWKKL